MVQSLFLFSHPNHEVAVYGTLKRLQPVVIFLTDGGGAARVEQTKRGLDFILDLQRAHFLNHSEQSFYEAVLTNDLKFWRSVVDQVSDIIRRHQPSEIYCDAVEFYNPVHDMSLPVARAAAKDSPKTALFEIPLIYQKNTGEKNYELQSVAKDLAGQAVNNDLMQEELDAKTSILAGDTYSILKSQLGNLISDAMARRAHREEFLKARRQLPRPASDQKLRYDERGIIQKNAGLVAKAITYKDHYAPLYNGLCAVGA